MVPIQLNTHFVFFNHPFQISILSKPTTETNSSLQFHRSADQQQLRSSLYTSIFASRLPVLKLRSPTGLGVNLLQTIGEGGEGAEGADGGGGATTEPGHPFLLKEIKTSSNHQIPVDDNAEIVVADASQFLSQKPFSRFRFPVSRSKFDDEKLHS
ncbi:hypothetical protein L1887_31846 [Cichorium endivia]|nr:hypothetical protein L1887_31846 [Cichorium endivia]